MSWIENRIAKVKEGETTELDLSVTPGAGAGSADHLSELPREILQLRSLTELDLSGHLLKELPAEIENLENLEQLNLSWNRGLLLPPELGYMPNLRRLKLSGVRSVPAYSFRGFEHLAGLDIGSTGFVALPAGILELAELTELDLSHGPANVLPELAELGRLESLALGDRNTSWTGADLMPVFRALGLKKLVLDGPCDLRALEAIGELRQLEKLALSGQLTVIPETWLDLPLTSLRLSACVRPATVANMQRLDRFGRLTELSLEGYRLEPAFWDLEWRSQLQALRLRRVGLEGFPERVLGCSRLEELELRGGRIEDVPGGVARLTRLENLNLSGNPIRRLPAEMAGLQRLTRLSLVATRLEALPPELSRLAALKAISLNGASLKHWPEELTRLPNLEDVGLSYTGINEIPALAVRGWTQLKRLDVSGNPITSPPPEVVARGTAAIQSYFAAPDEYESTPPARASEPCSVGSKPAAVWSPIRWRVKPA
ncbi:MAG: leucine-rich repeat domain-containing protein [Polyangiaceae bacterium]|nr:leucine-rich repeat domain-containing protein [Polyangiaceae bacterium]